MFLPISSIEAKAAAHCKSIWLFLKTYHAADTGIRTPLLHFHVFLGYTLFQRRSLTIVSNPVLFAEERKAMISRIERRTTTVKDLKISVVPGFYDHHPFVFMDG